MRAVIPAILLAVLSAGCKFGAQALERSHGPYGEAVAKVEEEQLLRQIVRLRYNETSVGLDITAIASQYELSGGAEARPFFSTEATGNLFRSFTTVLPFASATGSTRPTV